MKYVSPVAELVKLEAVSVILTSAAVEETTTENPCPTYSCTYEADEF